VKIVTLISALLLLASTRPLWADDRFDNREVHFDKDTIVDFTFKSSNGAYRSIFGVIDLTTGLKTPLLTEVKPFDKATSADELQPKVLPNRRIDDYTGTPGNTVPQPRAQFLFKGDRTYAFYLESFYGGKRVGTLPSSDGAHLRTDGDFLKLSQGGVTLNWDDTGLALIHRDPLIDLDYNDFVVKAGGYEACPFDDNLPAN